MMKKYDQIRIYLFFPAIEKEYECQVNGHNHFADIIQQIYQFKEADFRDLYMPNEDMIVYHSESGLYCSTHMSLKMMNVRDGMSFKLY